MSAIERSIECAKSKSDLRARIDELEETDSVVLIVGKRRVDDDGREMSCVSMTECNAHGFESVGLIEVARQRLFRYYET